MILIWLAEYDEWLTKDILLPKDKHLVISNNLKETKRGDPNYIGQKLNPCKNIYEMSGTKYKIRLTLIITCLSNWKRFLLLYVINDLITIFLPKCNTCQKKFSGLKIAYFYVKKA